MSAYEMMLSETQERMLLVVKKGTEKEFIDLFKSFDIESAVVGEVIEEKVFKIEHNDKIWADIPVDALDSDEPIYYLLSKEAAYYKDFQIMNLTIPEVISYSEMIHTLLTKYTIKKINAIIPVNTLNSDATINYLLSKEAAYYKDFQNMNLPIPEVTSHSEMLKTLLSQETIASKEWVYNQFNSNSNQQTLKGP